MADGMLFVQAVADSASAYRDFPLIGSRAAVWIAAEIHLMFAAFVLGVPIFAVVAEAIGIFGKDARYDRLSKEFTRLLLIAYSATAIWGAVFVFFLATLYQPLWAYLTAIFAPSMWVYVGIFFLESFTLYLYYYGWDRWKYGRAKLVHWGLGILLNIWGTTVMFIADSWLTYMMTPPRDITPNTDPRTIKLWHAILNHTWMPINIHRLIGNVVFGGAIVGAYASYRFLAAKTDEERAHYDWMGYIGNFVAICAFLPLPFAGYYLAKEIYAYSQTLGLTMMGGSLSGGNITPAAEFNIYVDPEAARIVFQSGIPITMVGLDVTRKTSLTEDHVRVLEAAQNPVSQAAAKIGRNAINHNRERGFLVGPNMHDSLAVAAFLDPTILKWQEYYVDVETTGELTAGETLGYSPMAGDLKRKPGMEKDLAANMTIRGSAPTLATTKTSPVVRDKFMPNTNVGMDVDSARFFELLIGRLSGKN